MPYDLSPQCQYILFLRQFRQANMHMVQTAAFQFGKDLTYEERQRFTSNVAAPILYKYSDAAYFSESDYGANDWKIRYVLIRYTLLRGIRPKY